MNITSHKFLEPHIVRTESLTIKFEFEGIKHELWINITNGNYRMKDAILYYPSNEGHRGPMNESLRTFLEPEIKKILDNR